MSSSLDRQWTGVSLWPALGRSARPAVSPTKPPRGLSEEHRGRHEAIIRDLTGIPFEFKGTHITGCDCLGMIPLYYERMGLRVTLPPAADQYSTRAWRHGDHRYRRHLEEVFDYVPEGWPLHPGDLVIFAPESGVYDIGHTGILSDAYSGAFLSAFWKRGSKLALVTERYWHQRFLGFMRHRKIAEIE